MRNIYVYWQHLLLDCKIYDVSIVYLGDDSIDEDSELSEQTERTDSSHNDFD